MNSQDYKVRKETPCVCLLHKARTAPPLLCIHPSPFTQSFWVRLEHNHLIAKSMQLSSPIPLSLNKSLATTRYVDGYQKGEKTKNPHPRENEPSADSAQERTCWAEERRCSKGVDERNDEVAMLVTTTLQKRRSHLYLVLN
jgi:hypothetical protein